MAAEPPPLRVAGLDPDPLAQLRRWVDEAARAGEPAPLAAALTTVGPDGRPRSRVVPVREVAATTLVVHTRVGGGSGGDLLHRPGAVAVLFHWPRLGRQVVVDATAEVGSPPEADAAFARLPRDRQVAAWARSGEPGPLPGRDALAQVVAEARARWGGADQVPRPPSWSVVHLVPEVVQLWQRGADGVDDRIAYERHGGTWRPTRWTP